MYVITKRVKVTGTNGNAIAVPESAHTVTPCVIEPPEWAIPKLKELGVLFTMGEAVKRGYIEADGSRTAETQAEALEEMLKVPVNRPNAARGRPPRGQRPDSEAVKAERRRQKHQHSKERR